jgi:hypothetical protein
MAVQSFVVDVEGVSGTPAITLSNVVSINFKTGRERQLDQYATLSGTIVVRQPSAPNAVIKPGSTVKVTWDDGGIYRSQFSASISNVQMSYGIPFAGGVGNADYLTISLEGYFARCGRASGENYAMAADTLFAQRTAASTASGLNIAYSSGGVGPAMGATTVSGTWGDWVNSVCLTTNGRMRESFNGVFLFSPFYKQEAIVSFSDDSVAYVSPYIYQSYDRIEFASYADNFYTQVTVDPESFAAQTVQTGVKPFRTYTANTLNASTGQATDYANYLLNNFTTSGLAITSFSCLANDQDPFRLWDLSNTANSLEVGNCVGAQINVIFRGTTYPCIIEGAAFTAVPGEARYTYYVSGVDQNAYLILDNATFGTLDFNRLGY